VEGFGYLVGGLPTAEKSSTRRKTQEAADDKTASPSAAVAASAVHEKARERRRRRATVEQLGRGHEYMDLDDDLDPDDSPTAASDRGAGTLGFAGTVRSDAAAGAAGLTALAGDEFGGGPATPMVPGTWDPDAPDPAGEGTERD
jgi:PPE-repeat protein